MTFEGDDLPNSGRVIRYVPYAKMRRDEDDNFLGPSYSAFEERPNEDYLSVTWCEYFSGTDDQQCRCSIEAIRNSKMNVKPKACFCVASIEDVLHTINDSGRTGRIIYYPVEDNYAHAGVHNISADDLKLMERLATETWSSFLTKEGADALPLGDCSKSNCVGAT